MKRERSSCLKSLTFRYQGKIDYKFKPTYDVNKMTQQQLKLEDEESDIIINSQDVPTILLGGVIKVAVIVEQTLNSLGYSGFKGFAKDMAVCAQSGYFNSEVEQLSIELKEILARPPKERFAGKIALIAYNTWEKNVYAQHSTVPDIPPEQLNNIYNKGKGL